MIIEYVDPKYDFVEFFDTDTGFMVRSGVLTKDAGIFEDTNIDPFMRSFPNLLDIGVMGHCIHKATGNCQKAGVYCYQGNDVLPNMSIENFAKIMEQSKGKVHQCALGGRGDPNKHESFYKLLLTARLNNIVPSYTTSGYGLSAQEIEYSKLCGAVAVSYYRQPYTDSALERLIKAGVKTNIHYVIGKNTIDQAISDLNNFYKAFPQGLNALIFLLHKPIGLGSVENCLDKNDPRVKLFFETIEKNKYPFKLGFDACFCSGIVNHMKTVNPQYVTPCDSSTFSSYISSDMIMVPCSFDSERKYGVDLNKFTMQEAWDSEKFESFRNLHKNSCINCSKNNECKICPIVPHNNLCKNCH